MSGKKLRILCFHGYRQNELLFREKTGSMRKLFKSAVEFEFLSAPLEPNVPDDDTRENSRAWWFSKPNQQFSSRDVTDIAEGFSESVEVVLNFLKDNGPFDGFLGFSQGASMVHLLLAMEKLNRVQLDIRLSNFSTLHIYGRNDQIVLPETSKKLTSLFNDYKCIEHDGGHFIPSLAKCKQDFLSFLSQF